MSHADLPQVQRDADEQTTLVQLLDHHRSSLLQKCAGLDDAQLRATLDGHPSTLTLAGLLIHMALVEDSWISYAFAGNDGAEPWASFPWDDDPDYEFNNVQLWSGDQLRAWLERSASTTERIVSGAPSLEARCARPNEHGDTFTLRWAILHLIEEYAQHCGHADLLREAIDGLTTW